MAVRSKTALGKIEHKAAAPKLTSIGQGKRSRPDRSRPDGYRRKKLREQGKG